MSGVEGSSLPRPPPPPPPPTPPATLHRRAQLPPPPPLPAPASFFFRPPSTAATAPFSHFPPPPPPSPPPPRVHLSVPVRPFLHPPPPAAADAAAAAPDPGAAAAPPAPSASDRETPKNEQIDETEKPKVEPHEGVTEQGHGKESTIRSGASVKRPRKPKASKHTLFMSDSPGTAEGAPGNSPLSANICRYDSSLGLLTKKFINLLQRAEDGTLDLNKAAEILEVQKRRIYDITNVLEGVDLIEKKLKNRIRWKGFDMSRPKEMDQQVATLKAEVESLYKEDCRLDERIRDMQDRLQALTADESKRKWLYLTKEDINKIPCFLSSTLIAINAPHGTSVEVPDPDEGLDFSQKHYQILLRSSMGPIDCYLISNNEERPDASDQNQQLAPMDLDHSDVGKAAMSVQPMDHVSSWTPEQGQSNAASKKFSESSMSQEFMAGILRIVPSDVDIDADYWLSSDLEVSITDTWGT